MAQIRQLSNEHIERILAIQSECYPPELLEHDNTFRTMMQIYPTGCNGIFTDDLAGYLFFHPFTDGKIKPLDTQLHLAGDENCMYIHDLAIRPSMQSKGYSTALLADCERITKENNFKTQALVAVQHSHSFWQKKGFVTVSEIDYHGLPAKYMRRIIPS
ncbi:MAG TPA: GNAT family N-acetyltransferase [Acidobacteriota bacterium]|nr:GNAT family N-acetyltransferase [Acidobacteriota bacterium]